MLSRADIIIRSKDPEKKKWREKQQHCIRGDMLQNDPLTKCVLILFPRGTQKFSLPLTTHHRTSQAQLKCPQQRTQYREKSLKQKQKRRNKIVVSYCKQKLQKVSYLVLLYYFFNTQHPKMNKSRPVPGSWETNAAMEKETMIPWGGGYRRKCLGYQMTKATMSFAKSLSSSEAGDFRQEEPPKCIHPLLSNSNGATTKTGLYICIGIIKWSFFNQIS